MSNDGTKVLPKPVRGTCQIIVLILVCAIAAVAQQPSLQITSPANNALVNPGGTLTLTINSSPSGTTFSQIAIIGPGFIGFNVIAPTSMPTQFSLPVPLDADCRVYALTVDGVPASGGGATPAQLQIDVEHSDAAVGLSAFPVSLTFQSQGEQSSVSFVATFTDPTFTNIIAADVTQSTLMSYVSSNSNVATVDASGGVSAVAPGYAVITATYGQGAGSFPLSVPVTVLPPRLTASPASVSFPAQTVGISSSPQQVTLTNTSTGPINTIAASTTGDFSESDSCTGSSPLAVGSSCTVNVTFSPGGGGPRTGTLSLANSSSVVPTAVALTGTGVVVPFITSVSPVSGPIGTSVTITGANFGGTQGTSTVTFNGTPTTPTSWSATGIVAPVPTGATTGNVVVTVGGVASNGVSFTVAAAGPPSITSINPTSGLAGTSVTISGTNFGTTQGTSTVAFNGVLATATSWSDTSMSIVAAVPTGATSGNVVVTVGGVASNGVSFTVPPSTTPNITSINPISGVVGTHVAITGMNFRATQGKSTVTFNGTAAKPTNWSDTSIVVPVPTGATTGNVVVTVGGIAGNGFGFTVICDPTLPTCLNP